MAATTGPMPGGAGHAARPEGVSRRERVRAATVREIKETARRFLVEQGPEAVTLRAIAREMGMTAPALYRYFDSHEELLRHVMGDIFVEVSDGIHAAVCAAAPGGLAAKFTAAAREFRRWSLSHPREFGLVFGSPLPGVDFNDSDVAEVCGQRFTAEFLGLYLELWREQPFPVPADTDIDPALLGQLVRFRDAAGVPLPAGAILSFAYCWVRLYGMVSMEVYGHLGWVLDDAGPLFEEMLKEVLPMLGLRYQPARPGDRPTAVYP